MDELNKVNKKRKDGAPFHGWIWLKHHEPLTDFDGMLGAHVFNAVWGSSNYIWGNVDGNRRTVVVRVNLDRHSRELCGDNNVEFMPVLP